MKTTSVIKNQCIESKIVKLNKPNRSQPLHTRSNDEQKCIHQLHTECLNLSNLEEGCLVCNALIVGRKYELATSFSKIATLNSKSQQQSTTGSSPVKSSLLIELMKLNRAGWYWGKMSRFEAESKLINTAPGTFLIRDSFDQNYILSLSFRIQDGVFHTRIEYRSGYFYFYLHPHKKYETVSNLVDDVIASSETGIYYYVRSAKTNKEIRFSIKLDKPLSRLKQIKSLKHLCRFTIKQHIRYDLIASLPLPDSIKCYLDMNHF